MRTNQLVSAVVALTLLSAMSFGCADGAGGDNRGNPGGELNGDGDLDLPEDLMQLVGQTCGDVASICSGSPYGPWIYCDAETARYAQKRCSPCIDCCTVTSCSDTEGCIEQDAPVGNICFPGGYCLAGGTCARPQDWEGKPCDPETDSMHRMTNNLGMEYLAQCDAKTSAWSVVFMRDDAEEWIGLSCGLKASVCDQDSMRWVYCDTETKQYAGRYCTGCVDCCSIPACSDDDGCFMKNAPVGHACMAGGYCDAEGTCLPLQQWLKTACDPTSDSVFCMLSTGESSYTVSCQADGSWKAEVCDGCPACSPSSAP